MKEHIRNDCIFAEMIRSYPDVLADRKKLKAYLLDFFPEDALIRNTLLMAYDENIVYEMKQLKNIDKIRYQYFFRKMKFNYGILDDYIKNSLAMWGIALGFSNFDNENNFVDTSPININNPDCYEWEDLLDGIRITKYIENDNAEIIVPGMINDKPVIEISNAAFRSCWKIKKVIISEGIEIIGNKAFEHCVRLEEIVFPGTMKHIGSSAFVMCDRINNILIPNTVESIDKCAFKGCENLLSIILPNNLTIIKEGLLAGCSCLKNIVLPTKLQCIENLAFYMNFIKWHWVPKTMRLPDGLCEIYDDSFSSYIVLTSLYIPKTVHLIDMGEGVTKEKIEEYIRRWKKIVTIYCDEDSYAMQFAKTNGIPFAKAENYPIR